MASSLLSTPLNTLVPKNQKLITIDSNTNVADALQILSTNNIYSAPVKDSSKGTYFGFLDLADVVVFLITAIEEKTTIVEGSEGFMQAISKLSIDSAKNIADFSSTNPMLPLRGQDTLLEAFKLFESTGTHRIPLLKDGDSNAADISAVVTQIDVLRFIASHLGSLGDAGKKTLKDLDVKLDKVISVEIGARSLEAFKLMTKNRITGVAITNQDGTLFSNLSVKDIKEIKTSEIHTWMSKSVLELIQMIRNKQIDVSFPHFSCHIHSTLAEIITRLSVLRVHRLYITDDNNMPIGILTLGDLFKLIQKATA